MNWPFALATASLFLVMGAGLPDGRVPLKLRWMLFALAGGCAVIAAGLS
jgi:hypothetical protein